MYYLLHPMKQFSMRKPDSYSIHNRLSVKQFHSESSLYILYQDFGTVE